MDDTLYGARNQRGEWSPTRRVEYPPLIVWPPRPAALLRWLFGYPGYVLPFNLLYALVAIAAWTFATPSRGAMSSFGAGWIAAVLVRNAVVLIAWYGVFHLRLYVRRAQDTRFKYNAKWPAASSDRFTFGSQLKDNVFWTLASGLPIWTAWEVVTLWLFASGRIPWLAWAEHPVWFVALMLLIPLYRELHFYAVHLAPVPGHSGFERIEVGDGSLATNGHAHYLHHKYFEVNYADGAFPLDKWFGSFHDGSPEGDAAMKRRRLARAAQ